jgi:hypothetical protein
LLFQNQEKFANIWLVLTIQTVMPVGYTILLLSAENNAGKINATGRVVLRKMSQKSSALSILFEGGEGLLQIVFTNIAAKKPQPLL